jgi:hypothetical protein
VRLFLRGWLIVTLTALNVSQIAHGRYAGAFVCGTAISAVWWANAGSASDDRSWRAGAAYALGAGCGTLTGMVLARFI